MLQVNIRELRQGPVDTDSTVEPSEAPLAGTGVALAGPLEVRGRLQEAGQGQYLWRATLAAPVKGACRRCLAEVEVPVTVEVGVVFSADPDAEDDPSVYPFIPTQGVIDLAEAVREEFALAVPAFVECRPDCAGLCPRCGADLNAGPCGCAAAPEPN